MTTASLACATGPLTPSKHCDAAAAPMACAKCTSPNFWAANPPGCRATATPSRGPGCRPPSPRPAESETRPGPIRRRSRRPSARPRRILQAPGGISLPGSHLQNSTPIMREILSDVTTLDRICVIAPDFHPPRQRATVFGRDGQMGSVLARRFTGKVSELPLKCR